MPTANYVTIDGVAYSPKHPKAVAMRKQFSAGESVANSHAEMQPLGDSAQIKSCGLIRGSKESTPARAFVSTDEKKLNKTEKRFLDWLWQRALPGQYIGVQSITLKLADDCRYTPDFVTIFQGDIRAYEVKGFWRDDAKVKIKVAARMFPMRFVVVQWIKGQWQFSEVKP